MGASHYDVRVHLRLSVLEGDVADKRKQFHLLVENAGWVILSCFAVEPTQLRVRKRAEGFKLLPPNPWLFENCCSTPAISSPVSKISAKAFGSYSICFHRMLTPSQTISHLHRDTRLLLQSWINQRQVSCRIKPLSHRDWIDRHHHFQRRGYICIKNMASAGCSIRVSYYHVRMDYGLSLIERDIAAHPKHFVLTNNGNFLVHFAPGIEPPQRCSIQCSDSGEMSTRNLILLRKLQ